MHMCALVQARMYLRLYEELAWASAHAYLCERVLLLQRDDGKKHTGAYPFKSCALTDGGPENQPGVSSFCSRGYESASEQGPQTVLAGGRALTAARSPFLAAS